MKLKTDRKKDLSMIFAALIVALVYIICVIYIYQSLNVSETDSGESSRRQVAVIVKSTDSAFWKSVFSGAGAAATEYNLSVTTQGPENEDVRPYRMARRRLSSRRWISMRTRTPLMKQRRPV